MFLSACLLIAFVAQSVGLVVGAAMNVQVSKETSYALTLAAQPNLTTHDNICSFFDFRMVCSWPLLCLFHSFCSLASLSALMPFLSTWGGLPTWATSDMVLRELLLQLMVLLVKSSSASKSVFYLISIAYALSLKPYLTLCSSLSDLLPFQVPWDYFGRIRYVGCRFPCWHYCLSSYLHCT